MTEEKNTGDERKKSEQDSSHEPQQSDKPQQPPWYKRPLPALIAILVIITIIVVGTLWWLHARTYEYTDDAYIDVQSELVSPRISGQVLKVLVNENQEVAAGELLLQIDPSDYQNRLAQADAQHAQAVAQVEQQRAQRAVMEAQVAQAKANVTVAETTASNARKDLDRFQSAQKSLSGSVSQQQLDQMSANHRNESAKLTFAQQQEKGAEANLIYIDSQIDAAIAGEKATAVAIEQAKLNLSYTDVRASVAGRVAQKKVAVGNNVQIGMPLLSVVPKEVYITANFKETQLRDMRPGQPVDITIDAYPDDEMEGKVDSVQPSSGQAFSVLPAENATGNWVKIVQRVPVKVTFDALPEDPAQRFGPGMSVEVTVHVR